MKKIFISEYSLKTKNITSTKYKNLKIMKETTEAKIQQDIVLWYNNNYCLNHHNPRGLIFSVPNDSINAIETKRKVNTGLLKGVSDLIVITPNGKILFIEIKTEKGIQSESQKDFEQRIKALGYEYHVIRSLHQFKEILT